MSDEFGLLQLCRAKPRSVRICAEADRVIRTHDQAIGTFDQKTRLGLALVPSRQLKSGELKAGRSIKKYERAIIPRKAKTRQNSASTRRRRQQGDSKMIAHRGHCFCGAVEIQVQGTPEGMGYCHCASCRSWSAAPVTAFTLWKPQNVRVTKGAAYIGKFMKTEASHRQYCKRCGGHLMTDHPELGLVDVYATTIPTMRFAPSVHVNYAEAVLPMKDGLPKLRDFPAEMGGSGDVVPE
jgi:hypothetical protein